MTPCNEAVMIDRRRLEVVSERARDDFQLHHADLNMTMQSQCLNGLCWTLKCITTK